MRPWAESHSSSDRQVAPSAPLGAQIASVQTSGFTHCSEFSQGEPCGPGFTHGYCRRRRRNARPRCTAGTNHREVLRHTDRKIVQRTLATRTLCIVMQANPFASLPCGARQAVTSLSVPHIAACRPAGAGFPPLRRPAPCGKRVSPEQRRILALDAHREGAIVIAKRNQIARFELLASDRSKSIASVQDFVANRDATHLVDGH